MKNTQNKAEAASVLKAPEALLAGDNSKKKGEEDFEFIAKEPDKFTTTSSILKAGEEPILIDRKKIKEEQEESLDQEYENIKYIEGLEADIMNLGEKLGFSTSETWQEKVKKIKEEEKKQQCQIT